MVDEYTREPPEAPAPVKEPSRGGATAGIVLVVVGAVLLAAQFVPQVRWWAAWPLIFIIIGIVQAVTPGKEGWGVARLFEGAATIAFGVAFLAWTTGVVGAGFIGRLVSFWPVLIVAAGFDLLGKALHSQWIKAIGSLVVIGALAYVVGVSVGDFDGGFFSAGTGQGTETMFSEPVQGVSEATLKMNVGVAGVRLTSGDDLISVDAGDSFEGPEFDVAREGDSAEVTVNMGGEDFVMPGTGNATVEASVSDEVQWDMRIATGVSEFNADLSDVKVRSLELKPGVASCSVRLGDVPADVDEAVVDVKAGIASVSIELPDGVEARIVSKSGLTGHSISGDFESKGGGVWETPGFDQASGDGVWIVRVQSGIGSIDIDTY